MLFDFANGTRLKKSTKFSFFIQKLFRGSNFNFKLKRPLWARKSNSIFRVFKPLKNFWYSAPLLLRTRMDILFVFILNQKKKKNSFSSFELRNSKFWNQIHRLLLRQIGKKWRSKKFMECLETLLSDIYSFHYYIKWTR